MYTFQYAAPEELGIPSRALSRFLDRLEQVDIVHSFVLMRRGKVAMEGVRRPFDGDVPHQLFSVSKSFVSVAVGMARREGRLRLDDKLLDYFPEYAKSAHPRLARTRIADLLTMRSGFAQCTARRMFDSPDGDWVGTYFSLAPEGDPGAFFVYNSGATYMLAALLRRLTGENVREYLMPRLFAPLGIVPGIWATCPRGTDCGGWGLYLRIRDLAKFGQLLLDGGAYAGRELVPADYLAEAVLPHADNSSNTRPDWKCGYGYQFWRSTFGYRCDGSAGQYAAVLPEQEMMFAGNSATTNMQAILTALWEEVVPELADRPLPADPEAERRLRERIGGLAVPVASGTGGPESVHVSYRFAPNAYGIAGCTVEAEGDACALTFLRADGTCEQLRAGFGKFVDSTFRLTDRYAHPTAASAAWRDGKLVIEAFILDGIYRSTYTVDLAPGAAEPVARKDTCTCFRPAWERLIPLP